MVAAREAAKAVVVMAGGSNRGNEVMARVATRVGVPMAANVVAFHGLSPFVVTRQVVGGAAWEDMRLGHRPAVFTVAGHAVEAAPGRGAGRRGRSSRWRSQLTPADLAVRAVSVERESSASGADNLKSARVVVGAGRGAGGPDGFDHVLELAKLLGGSLGVSRVVTSLGLASAPRAGRPDRQPDRARALHPLRHQRRDPALGRLRELQGHPGDQHRRRGPDDDQGDLRRCR